MPNDFGVLKPRDFGVQGPSAHPQPSYVWAENIPARAVKWGAERWQRWVWNDWPKGLWGAGGLIIYMEQRQSWDQLQAGALGHVQLVQNLVNDIKVHNVLWFWLKVWLSPFMQKRTRQSMNTSEWTCRQWPYSLLDLDKVHQTLSLSS